MSSALCTIPGADEALALEVSPAAQLQRIRDALAALRGGQEGLEHFLEILFDDLDASWNQIDHEGAWIDGQRQELKLAHADLVAQRTQWESDRRQWHDALQQRVVELEKDRMLLQSELESARSSAGELLRAMSDERERNAADRAAWTAEFRMLRELLDHRSGIPLPPPSETTYADSDAAETLVMAALPDPGGPLATHEQTAAENAPIGPAAPQYAQQRAAKPAGAHPADPVLGPLLSQFERLQRDVAKRRAKTGRRGP